MTNVADRVSAMADEPVDAKPADAVHVEVVDADETPEA